MKYQVTSSGPCDLTDGQIKTGVDIIVNGDAVDPESAAAELPLAKIITVARSGEGIVGIGAIKRKRPTYAKRIATRSGISFDSEMHELGYVAVDKDHQGNHLSGRIVADLLSKHEGPLFATTSSERMKATLMKAGFVQKGQEWQGQMKGENLSLWIKEDHPSHA